jgi:polyphenol oxidase
MPMESIINGPIATAPEAIGDEQTLAETGFYWRELGGIKVLICRRLEGAGFVNGFSTRLGGVSPFPGADLNLAGYDEDTAENIEENRRRFLAGIGSQFELSTVWQVHGDTIKVVRTDEDAAQTDEKADAIISDRENILIGVKTADCVPVLIGDPVTGAFAAVHAGWRGTASLIVEKSVKKMADFYGVKPENMIAAIGPSATCRRYEVGSEVIDAFAGIDGAERYFTPTREGHALVDLVAANRDQLTRTGLRAEEIFISPFCTMERTDLFFSYRIEKKKYGKTGRSLSVIGRKLEQSEFSKILR